ncbi:putative secreted Zn-dependent protease [Hoeflea marina]|uniref:Putative secreted Zn-dependent protease n=1 Tax=Hoeflea marina TaxID=274592 RepID=A0A317PTE7_9HYPH|nr:DUF922 domain-containing protein [Hoeflea marina]PWW04429.1 putative secreted Zn-dependent protease [Hoeflea marina]
MGLRHRFVIGLCLAVLPAQAGADMISNKSYSYFTIGGKTAGELDRELSRSGPFMKETGLHHPGATKMKFTAAVTYESTANRCRVKSARISVDTRIILPKWKHRRQATRSLGVIWDTLSRDIKRHEERHAEIARQYARKIDAALLRLPARDGCDALRAEVNKASERILKAHYAEQASFDRAEAASFERRMSRMLRFKAEAMAGGG